MCACSSYPSIRDRLILLNGWSKTYAMTGWRLGYAIWPGKLYDMARKLAVNLHSCVNAPAQFAGLAALTGPQDAVHKMVAEFDKRRKVVVDGPQPAARRLVRDAEGRVLRVSRTSSAPAGRRRRSPRRCWRTPASPSSAGPDFGMLGEGYVRLSYANSTENILKALDRMGEFLASRKAA